MNTVPRPEYPRPQFVRNKWLNLNGAWEFEFDFSKSGKERGFDKADAVYSNNIIVPFCPESKLSGIEYKDFIPACWYKRQFDIPEDWFDGRIILRFGAVDYHAEVWINDQYVGKHDGGYTSFSFDITDYAICGSNFVNIYVEDNTRDTMQPSGKQSINYESSGCLYTRCTGIWQTVWLEAVPNVYITNVMLRPDPENSKLFVQTSIIGDTRDDSGYVVGVRAFYDGQYMGGSRAEINWHETQLCLDISELHLWEPGNPNLYNLEIRIYKDGIESDLIDSYFGMRSIAITENEMLINGKPVFQRLVLDQGYYPDGVYTAPDDDNIKNDILISLNAGFNGARLHQKVFEPRYLFWADKLGYIVWGEYASWGLDVSKPESIYPFVNEWSNVLRRDYSHPSIIGWCPFNETSNLQDNNVINYIYKLTKLFDPTRPVIDTSGFIHVDTDIYDVHDYEQNISEFAQKYDYFRFENNPDMKMLFNTSMERKPFFVSEYGGIYWSNDKDQDVWGYGDSPKSEEEFMTRYEELTAYLLEHPKICAFCYTQLYDVEQERNGLYTYYREPKFDISKLRSINLRKAAIEL